MSSQNLEDGEIISEEPNEAPLQANDKLVKVNSKLGKKHCNSSGGGVGAGLIVATVSISMEHSQKLGYEAHNSVDTVDGNVTATTTLSMSRTQTRKIITTAYTSADCPLDFDPVVTFVDDQPPIAKLNNKSSNSDDGNMKRNKRKIASKKNNAEIQPPKKRSPNKNSLSLKGNRFSVLTSDSQIDDFIDEDEMLCVRGASPQHEQSAPYPTSEILTNLCFNDKNVDVKLKPLKKTKARKYSSKRAGNSRSKKSKKININKTKTTKQVKTAGFNGADQGFAFSEDELPTLHVNGNIRPRPVEVNSQAFAPRTNRPSCRLCRSEYGRQRKTRAYCFNCDNAVCGEHSTVLHRCHSCEQATMDQQQQQQ